MTPVEQPFEIEEKLKVSIYISYLLYIIPEKTTCNYKNRNVNHNEII
jgi:hypothetical protein